MDVVETAPQELVEEKIAEPVAREDGQPDVVVSWDGETLAWLAEDLVHRFTPEEGDSPLPELPPEIASIGRIYWPVELLAVRSFQLPLGEVKHLDAAILTQEMAEMTGDEEDFWLLWQAGKVDQGVAGLMFGLPMAIREAVSALPLWNGCPLLLSDGVERLNAVAAETESCAVIDEDSDGAFIGFRQAGVWRGIRRLNREITSNSRLSDEQLVAQAIASWQAMLMDEADPLIGRCGREVQALIGERFAQAEIELLEELPDRHAANLALASQHASGLNFRHGQWAASRNWHGMERWRRPLALAAGLLLVWIGATLTQIHTINSEAETYRQRIEAAFHRGLPDEKVMLDPLAQLRKAAGSGVSSQQSAAVLAQLQYIAAAYKEHAWRLKELSFDHDQMLISGTAPDIEALNRIRDSLRQISGREVVISDTDLSGDQVTFRMKW